LTLCTRPLGAVQVVLVLLVLCTAGCSWLVGVSEDPVVVDGIGSDDAGDEDAAADARAE
jgi:hypothetical protein